MKVSVRKKFSDKLGTHYEIFLDEILIHNEFSRSVADEISERIQSGEILGEILEERSRNQMDSEYIKKIRKLEKTIDEQKKQICELSSNIKSVETNSKQYPFNPIEIAKGYSLPRVIAYELSELLMEVKPFQFEYSYQLSEYIKKNKNEIEFKYKNISGVLSMSNGDHSWKFDGGIHKQVYGIMCRILHLKNKGTDAIPGQFDSYQEMQLINKDRRSAACALSGC